MHEPSANPIILLDGGMGQELLRRSGREPTALWSAQVMMDQPEIVRDLHLDYIRAGSRVITLNTYAATPERLANHNIAQEFEPLQTAAIGAAREARELSGVDGVKIAGCLPPLVTSYRPDLAPEFETALDLYRRVSAVQANHVDLILCETMASIPEARAAAQAAQETGLPVWVALTIGDDKRAVLRSGESLAEALSVLDEIGVEAILLNCSRPEAISESWPVLATSSRPVGAYANGFTTIMKLEPESTVKDFEARQDLNPTHYADFAFGWAQAGASIVGGCCEVGPLHIRELATRLADNGYSITGDLT